MLLLANAEIGSIRPFDIGFFLGLIYAGENLPILSSLFVIALFIASPTLETLLFSGILIGLTISVYYIYHVLNRRVNLLEINLIALISRLPIIVIGFLQDSSLADLLINALIAQVFVLVCLISLYSIVKRGIRIRIMQDEWVCMGILLAVIALALYTLDIMNFMPYYLVCAFAIVACVRLGSYKAVVLAAILGLGGAIASNDITVLASIVGCTLIALAFSKLGVVFVGFSYALGDIGIGYYFSTFGGYDILHLIAVLIGIFIAMIIPNKYYIRTKNIFATTNKGLAAKALVNINRFEMGEEIRAVSRAFNDIRISLLSEKVEADAITQVDNYVDFIKDKHCASCPHNSACYTVTKDYATHLIKEMVDSAVRRNKATILDSPPLLTSKCVKLQDVVSDLDNKLKQETKRKAGGNEIDKAKKLLATQSGGISKLLDKMSNKISKSITTDERLYSRLLEELSYHNITCHEIILWNELEKGITLVVRKKDAYKKIILESLYKTTGTRWTRSEIVCEYPEALIAMTYHKIWKYDILLAETMATKAGSIISGDTRSITRVGKDNIMIALCDGMGTGVDAEKESSNALEMIENLYKAGLDNELILELTNSLLVTRNDESFTALDMAVIDLNSGIADFIKLGGVSGYISTPDTGIVQIKGGALPIGILEDVTPNITTRQLTTKDICLIVSDGIPDTIGTEKIMNILASNSNYNPQLIVDQIAHSCVEKGIADDITAIAFRIYRKL